MSSVIIEKLLSGVGRIVLSLIISVVLAANGTKADEPADRLLRVGRSAIPARDAWERCLAAKVRDGITSSGSAETLADRAPARHFPPGDHLTERPAETAASDGRAPIDVEELHRLVLQSLDDDQAQEVVSIPLHGKSNIADHMVIASGRSTRHNCTRRTSVARCR